MLIHSGGCQYLIELVLTFACILNRNGFKVKLDLLENTLIREMGPASYYENSKKESDFVIIIFSDAAGSYWLVTLSGI